MVTNKDSKRTSPRDVLCYHVDKDTCRKLEEVDNTICPSDCVDPLMPLINGFRKAGVPEDAIHILRLVPMIHVAWADTAPQPEQRQCILTAAHDNGIRPGLIVFKLLELWLTARPDASMFSLWSDYIGALQWVTTEEDFSQLRNASIVRAQATAEAMQSCLGGLLPTGPHQTAVDRIAAEFDIGRP